MVGVNIDITDRKHDEERLATRIRQQRALFHLADDLNRANSLDEVYTAGFDALFEGLRCNRAAILRFDNAGVMRFVNWRGLSSRYRAAVEGHSPWQQNDHNAQPVSVADAGSALLNDTLKAALKGEGVQAVAFIPLVFGGRLVGKFMVYYNLPHVFEGEEIEFCLTISHQLAFGINRKEAEQALQEKAALLDLSSDAIVMRDSQDRVVYWSKGATELYGYSEQEAMGRVTHELFSTEFPEPLEQIRQQLFANSRWSGELVHSKKDGSKISVSSRWCLACDPSSDMKSILETNRDITAEMALRKIREEFARKGETITSKLIPSSETAIA
jgi:PAS domain S-box-containing protein